MLSLLVALVAGVDIRCGMGWTGRECEPGYQPRETPRYEYTMPQAHPAPIPVPPNPCVFVPVEHPLAITFIANQEMVVCERGEVAWHGATELRGQVSTGMPTRKYSTKPSITRLGLEPITFIDKDACSRRYPDKYGNCTPMPNAVFFGHPWRDGEAFHEGNISRKGLPENAPYGKSHGCTRLSAKMAHAFHGYVKERSRFGKKAFVSEVRALVVFDMRALRDWRW